MKIRDKRTKWYNQRVTNPLATKSPLCEEVAKYRKDRVKGNECNDTRNFFRQDRDRIQYSTAFRRMMHKTQVQFTQGLSEHNRNRLTHTLEVAQIGRSIARDVGANEDLVEAICLGHDLGHTPFGHAGEEGLQIILKELEDPANSQFYNMIKGERVPQIYKKIPKDTLNFWHNFQSFRVAEELEWDGKGMGLLYQTLDGMIKHTGKGFKGKNYEKDIFFNIWKKQIYKNIIDKIFKYDSPISLEGHIARVADEIAQVSHDLEDFLLFSEGIEKERLEYTLKKFKEILDKRSIMVSGPMHLSLLDVLNILNKNVGEMIALMESKKSKVLTKDEIHPSISVLIEFFIRSVVNVIKELENQSEDVKNRETFWGRKYKIKIANLFKYENEKNKIQDILFTHEGYGTYEDIRNLIMSNYVRHTTVARSDSKGIYLIRKIFNAYMTTPRELPEKTLNRYARNVMKYSNENLNNYKEILKNGIKLAYGKKIKMYKKEQNISMIMKNLFSFLKDVVDKKITFADIEDKDLDIFSIIMRRDPIFIMTVIDYISGMTDNRAYEEYRSLYM